MSSKMMWNGLAKPSKFSSLEKTVKYASRLWEDYKQNPEKYRPALYARNDPQSRLTLAHYAAVAEAGWNPLNGNLIAGRRFPT